MPFLHLLFLVPLAQNSQYAKTVCFGVANSNPPQLLMVGLFAVSEGPRSLNSALQTVHLCLWPLFMVPLWVGQPHGVEWTSPEDVWVPCLQSTDKLQVIWNVIHLF